MGSGILLKGFKVYNDVMEVRIPKGTLVSMGYSGGVPTVWFQGCFIKLMRIDRRWYADVYGQLLLMEFPKGGLPWPLDYFKS